MPGPIYLPRAGNMLSDLNTAQHIDRVVRQVEQQTLPLVNDFNAMGLAIDVLNSATSDLQSEIETKADQSDVTDAEAALEALIESSAVGRFFFTFDDDISAWTEDDSATLTYPSEGITGGRVLQSVGTAEYTYPASIPYDPAALYRIRARVRRTAGSATAKAYVGVKSYDGTGGTEVAPSTGAGNDHESHWYCVKGVTLDTVDAWEVFTGYFTAADLTADANAPEPSDDPTTPPSMVDGTKYIRPTFLFEDATFQIDYIRMEEVLDDYASAIAATLEEVDAAVNAGNGGQVFSLGASPGETLLISETRDVIGNAVYRLEVYAYSWYNLNRLVNMSLLPSDAENQNLEYFRVISRVVYYTQANATQPFVSHGISSTWRTLWNAAGSDLNWDTEENHDHRINLYVNAASGSSFDNDDLSSDWEALSKAGEIMRSDGESVDITGPSHHSVVAANRDETSPYNWVPANNTDILDLIEDASDESVFTLKLMYP